MIDKLPAHVAIIMDGNGRWAEARGLPKFKGHEAGMEAMIKIVRHASDLGIKHLTVYAFSTENWKRAESEISGIFDLLIIYVNRELAELCKNDVKVDILGDREPFSKRVNAALDKTLEQTGGNTGLNFHIALNYGGRAEIVRAAGLLAKQAVDTGEVGVNTVKVGAFPEFSYTAEAFANALYTAGVPDPDLLIRPGGEKRLSNFLLWQTAYSELVFSDTLWPDYTPEEFESALAEFSARKRRFGGRTAS